MLVVAALVVVLVLAVVVAALQLTQLVILVLVVLGPQAAFVFIAGNDKQHGDENDKQIRKN